MEKNASEFAVRAALKATSEIAALIPFVRQHTDDDEEYEHYRKAMTAMVRKASEEIFSPIFSQYPELEEAIDKTIKDFGRMP